VNDHKIVAWRPCRWKNGALLVLFGENLLVPIDHFLIVSATLRGKGAEQETNKQDSHDIHTPA